MMQKMIFNRFLFVLFVVVFTSATITVFAQNSSVTFSKTAEYDIGFKCPVASTLNPSKTEIWFLMDDCRGWNYTLAVYQLADGALVDMPDYATELEPLNLYDADDIYLRTVLAQTNPMAFTPEGDLSIHYVSYDFDAGTVVTYTVIIPVVTEGNTTLHENTTLDEILMQYSEYFEFTVYNHNHTRLAIWGDSSVHIIDVASESEIADIAVAGDPDYTSLWFSEDGLSLFAFRPNNIDNPDDPSSTLAIYRLLDGDLLNEYAISAYFATLSPDGTLAIVNSGSNDGEISELFVFDLATGSMSSAINVYENPRPVATCLNTGRNVSDVNFVTQGKFYIPSLHWLPDNSTIVAGASYGGDGAGGGGTPCIFNYSRLQVYSATSD